MSTIDDGLETRATQPVHSERRSWDGNATPQTDMTSDIRSIGRTLRKHITLRYENTKPSWVAADLPAWHFPWWCCLWVLERRRRRRGPLWRRAPPDLWRCDPSVLHRTYRTECALLLRWKHLENNRRRTLVQMSTQKQCLIVNITLMTGALFIYLNIGFV